MKEITKSSYCYSTFEKKIEKLKFKDIMAKVLQFFRPTNKKQIKKVLALKCGISFQKWDPFSTKATTDCLSLSKPQLGQIKTKVTLTKTKNTFLT